MSIDRAALEARAQRLQGTIERRAVGREQFELRAANDGLLEFHGHPALFASQYEMYGGPDKGGWIEHVNPDAFTRTLKAAPDVALNVDHGDSLSGLPIARTTAPGPVAKLALSTDKQGLVSGTMLDPSADDDVRQLNQKMGLGLVKQMSYAFRTIRQAWNEDYTERELLELDLNRGDVSIVTNGANADTSSSLRNLDDAFDFIIASDLAEVRNCGDKLIAVRKVLQIADKRSVDDNANDIASAVDAAIDAAMAYLVSGQTAQGIATLGAAQLSSDALLAMLGVDDPDEDDESDSEAALQQNKISVPTEQRQRLTLAQAQRLVLLDA